MMSEVNTSRIKVDVDDGVIEITINHFGELDTNDPVIKKMIDDQVQRYKATKAENNERKEE